MELNRRIITSPQIRRGVSIGSAEKISFHTIFLGLYFFTISLSFLPILENVSISRILSLLPAGIIMIQFWKWRPNNKKLVFAIITYFSYNVLSYIYSINRVMTMTRLTMLAMNFALILAVGLMQYNKKEMKFLLKCLANSAWIPTIFYAYNLTEVLNGERFMLRVDGALFDPNEMCGFFIFSIVYYFDAYLRNGKKRGIVNITVYLVVIFLSGSRGGLVAIGISMLVYLFLFLKNTKTPNKHFKLIFITVMTFIAIIIAFNLMPEDIALRFSVDRVVEDRGTGRFDIWEEILTKYKEQGLFKQIFGIGIATVTNITRKGQFAHNLWVETLMELGIAGLALTIYFYYIFLKKTIKEKLNVYTATFIGYMALSMSLSFASYKPLWTIIMLIIITNRSHMPQKQPMNINNLRSGLEATILFED